MQHQKPFAFQLLKFSLSTIFSREFILHQTWINPISCNSRVLYEQKRISVLLLFPSVISLYFWVTLIQIFASNTRGNNTAIKKVFQIGIECNESGGDTDKNDVVLITVASKNSVTLEA